MSMIDVSNISFTYEGSYVPVFEEVSFRIDTDWKLGFVGRNGRGKTTFINILAGKLKCYGSIVTTESFDVFPYEIPDKNLDAIDALYMAEPYLEFWKIQRELSLLSVEEDVLYRPFNTLSNGEQTKVMLAAMFSQENKFLLIDEPTNHLDSEGRELLAEYLRTKKGFLLVSHDRKFLDKTVDHMLIINKTNIEVQQGNFSSWWYNKSLRDKNELAENNKLKKEISKLENSMKQTSSWSEKVEKSKNRTQPKGKKPDAGSRIDKGYVGHKAAKMMKRSIVAERRKERTAEDKEKLLKDFERLDPLSIQPENYFKSRLVNASELAINYDGKKVFEDLSFTIDNEDRIALSGPNGCGKSSILKLLLQNANATSDKKEPSIGSDYNTINYSGSLIIGSNLKISYIPQDVSNISGFLSEFAEAYEIDEGIFKAILRKMDFPREQFEKNIRDFSEGQKKKVFLAKSLCERANLYIWDEPMNYIDVFTRMQIEMLMDNHKPTMIFVEHDEEFVERVATKVIRL